MTFAVVACSTCREPWSVDLRHRVSSCPRCGRRADLSRRTRFWEGPDARSAQQAAAALRAGADGSRVVATLADERPVARHDSPVDAAAAKAHGITNTSARAEEVVMALTRLLERVPRDDALAAMVKAGIPQGRAEKELDRMLATDVLFEPRAGFYAFLE